MTYSAYRGYWLEVIRATTSFEYQNVNASSWREKWIYEDISSSLERFAYLTGFLARPVVARGLKSKLSSSFPSDEMAFFVCVLEANMSSESESLEAFFLGEEALGFAFDAAVLVVFGAAAALGAGAFLGLPGPSVFATFPRPLPLGLASSSLPERKTNL